MPPRRKSQSRIFCTGKKQKEKLEGAVAGPSSLPVVDSSLRRIFKWRVPPNWSISEWRNEMRAEAACAAWQAVCDYDPSLGVPFDAFTYQRVLTKTLTRYRQEWTYALRLAQVNKPEELDTRMPGSAVSTLLADWPRSALATLTKSERWLIEQLFLRGRTEATIATEAGITQQAVNKRKSMILLRLRGYMTESILHTDTSFRSHRPRETPRLAERGPITLINKLQKNKST
jgi:DNA-directed RNA polymerase specialized sigma24 family protein